MENRINNKQNSKIIIKNLGFVPKEINCNRCFGTGRLPQFNHIEGGICFKCRGNKYITVYQKVA